MSDRIVYEWCCEMVRLKTGDREDLNHQDTFADALRVADGAPAKGYGYEIALWRLRYAPEPEVYGWDLIDTEYAYLETATGECWVGNGSTSVVGARMPVTFDGGANVPKRFLREVQKHIDAIVGVQS